MVHNIAGSAGTSKKSLIFALVLLPGLLSGQSSGSAAVTIRVTDAVSGKPIANHDVYIGEADFQLGHRTNGKGEIRLPSLREGTVLGGSDSTDWLLDGRAYRFFTSALLDASYSSKPVIQIRIFSGASVTGVLRDKSRRPIGNAHITPLRMGYNEFGRWIADDYQVHIGGPEVATDREGKFTISALPKGDYVFRMDPPDPLEDPVIGQALKFYSSYFPGVSNWEMATPVHLESGKKVDLGTAAIDTEPGALVHFVLPHSIADAEHEKVRFSLQATSVSEFVIRFAGRILAIPNENSLDLRLPKGEYVLEEVSATPRLKGTFTSDSSEKTVEPGPWRAGHLRLQGKMASGEMPPENVEPLVSLLAEARKGTDYRFPPATPTIGIRAPKISPLDPSKSFRVEAGEYRVSASVHAKGVRVLGILKDGREQYLDKLEVAAGSDTTLTVVLGMLDVMDRTGVSGIVIDEAGRVVTRATVVLMKDEDSQPTWIRFASSDAQGRFELEAAPGTYRIFAWYRDETFAHPNRDFMKAYESRGIPIRLGDSPLSQMTLKPLDKKNSF